MTQRTGPRRPSGSRPTQSGASEQSGQAQQPKKDQAQQQAETDQQKASARAHMYEETTHHPPGCLLILGLIGTVLGAGVNVIQWMTTNGGVWDIQTPQGTIVNHSSDPWKFLIGFVIATGAQLGVLFTVFRIKDTWKKRMGGTTSEQVFAEYWHATVEVMSHDGLISAWAWLAFGADTAGDFLFVSGILQGVNIVAQIVLTALYAIFLYAISTVGFVHSIEYIWAAMAASNQYIQRQQGK